MKKKNFEKIVKIFQKKAFLSTKHTAHHIPPLIKTQCGKSFTLQVLQQRAREVAESQLWDQTVAGSHQKVLGLEINFTKKF